MMCHVDTASVCPFCDLSDVTPEEMNLHINSVGFNATKYNWEEEN